MRRMNKMARKSRMSAYAKIAVKEQAAKPAPVVSKNTKSVLSRLSELKAQTKAINQRTGATV
jgi:hypothetical protein